MAYSPDGSHVAMGCSNASACLVDAATGDQVWCVDHGGPVDVVVFSPDGTKVATGSDDRSARVLDAATGAELCRLDHTGVLHGVAFSPDGAWVATGSDDGSVRVWIVDHEGLLAQAAGRLTRNLTGREWRRYFGDQPYRKTRADLP